MSITLRPPSHSLVVAYLALFLAMGGTSYAAVVITGKDVKNSSLTGADVRDGGLLRKDFRSGQLPGGATGATGATGARGPAGPTAGATGGLRHHRQIPTD